MNVELLLWCIVITNIVNAVASIIMGATGAEKSKHYGACECIYGIVSLVLCIVILAT